MDDKESKMDYKSNALKLCIMCNKDKSPYKCPKCGVFYCSVACCNLHKYESCNGSLTNADHSKPHELSIADSNYIKTDNSSMGIPLNEEQSIATKSIYATDYNLISPEQLDRLRNSSDIINLLKSKRLREHIIQIDSSSNRQDLLKKMRSSNSEFDAFVTSVLSILESTNK